MSIVIGKENKGASVSDLTDKAQIAGHFLVKEKVFGVGKNGKSYLSLQLVDRTGGIDTRVWENAEALQLIVQVGDIVHVKGVVQTFQNRLQLVAHKIDRLSNAEVEAGLFVTASRRSPDEMERELHGLVDELQESGVKKLLHETLNDPQIKKRLLVHPAAKTIHHAYRSGLLEHILSIAKILKFLHSHYRNEGVDLDWGLMLFGAIYHDIGKLSELDGDGPYHYTDRGRLVGHMAIALEMLDARSKDIPELDLRTLDKLKHIVLSHHGKLEHGSPKEPAFIEAALIAMIDDFDSKASALFQFISSEKSGGGEWSRLHPQYNRYFLLKS